VRPSRSAWSVITAAGIGMSGFTALSQAVPARTAFVGVSLLPMATDTLLSDQTVLVEKGVITHIGARSATPVPPGTLVIEGNGGVLMPGLADMHVHLEDEADLRRYLEAGVTLVRNMRGEPRHLQWREEIAAGRRLGPRIITTGPTLAGAVRRNPRHISVTNASQISTEVRAQAAAGYDLVKVHSGLSPRLLAVIGAVAESTHHAVVGHLMEGGLEAALGAHQASIEHVDAEVWTAGAIEENMARLARVGAYFCPTFTTFYDLDAESPRPADRHRALVASAQRLKVKMLAGTDLPPTTTTRYRAHHRAHVHDDGGTSSVRCPANCDSPRRRFRPELRSPHASGGSYRDRERRRSDSASGRPSFGFGCSVEGSRGDGGRPVVRSRRT
jgi:imidazolonepropionase-like amidohydrolase